MNISKKPASAAAVVTIAAFLLQNCATMIRTPSQSIPVTSTPAGAWVFVDGKIEGATPLTLNLSRKNPGVIRIEREGYNPHEIVMTRRKERSSAGAGNYVIPGLIGLIAGISGKKECDAECEDGWGNLVLGMGLAGGLFMGAIVHLVDSILSSSVGANYVIYPTTLTITLTPIEGPPRVDMTALDVAGLRGIKWLRIAISGGTQ